MTTMMPSVAQNHIAFADVAGWSFQYLHPDLIDTECVGYGPLSKHMAHESNNK